MTLLRKQNVTDRRTHNVKTEYRGINTLLLGIFLTTSNVLLANKLSPELRLLKKIKLRLKLSMLTVKVSYQYLH